MGSVANNFRLHKILRTRNITIGITVDTRSPVASSLINSKLKYPQASIVALVPTPAGAAFNRSAVNFLRYDEE